MHLVAAAGIAVIAVVMSYTYYLLPETQINPRKGFVSYTRIPVGSSDCCVVVLKMFATAPITAVGFVVCCLLGFVAESAELRCLSVG